MHDSALSYVANSFIRVILDTSCSSNSQISMEPVSSLRLPQEPATVPCFESISQLFISSAYKQKKIDNGHDEAKRIILPRHEIRLETN
jgi:hypothetical protein